MEHHRTPGRATRKWRKFKEEPYRFFEDARNPLVRSIGCRVVASLDGVRAIDRQRRDASRSAHSEESSRIFFSHHTDWLARPQLQDVSRTPHDIFSRPSVSIIGDLNLFQCKKYRVMQKLEALRAEEIDVDYAYWLDIPRCMNLLQTSTLVIFFRIKFDSVFAEYCREATRLRVPFAYDIDDAVFDKKTYATNKNMAFLSRNEKTALLESSKEFFTAMRLCNFVITSTPALMELARRHYAGPVYLWRNALDHESLHHASIAMRTKATLGDESSGKVKLVYASGSRAHEADFRIIEVPLKEIMDRHREVELVILGTLNIPETLEHLKDRLTIIEFSDYPNYIYNLARASIALIPLTDDAFNQSKSAVRYLDAASVSIPVIASPVGDLRNIINNEETGLLADTSEDWYCALETLITYSELRQKLGSAGHEFVKTEQTTSAVFSGLDPHLRSLLLGHVE